MLFFATSLLTAHAASDDFIIRQLVGNDTTPPSAPTGFTAVPVALSQIDLAWNASSDNVAVTGYQVFRGDAQIATTTLTNYSDTGLTPSTTYAYYVTAFDGAGNVSASSTVVATTTLASSTPPVATTTPTTTPSGGGEYIELKAPGLLVTFLEVIPDRESVVIRYETAGFVRSTIKWGRTTSYEMGSLREGRFSRAHETRITGLSPGTHYYFTIEGENHVGVYGTLTSSSFTTLPSEDVLPPSNVSDLRAYKNGDDIVLEWKNPDDTDFEKIRVLRNDTFYPSDIADGWLVYEGDGERVRDEDIAIPNTIQYYTIFSYDERGNVSSGAVIAIEIGEKIVTEIDVTDETQNEIELSFEDIVFIQDGIVLPVHDGLVAIDGSKLLTMQIPYEALPEHLKTILVTLVDSRDSDRSFSFILRANEEKTAYVAHLAPLKTAGLFPVRVSVFDFKTAQIGYASGTIQSKIIFEREETDETFVGYLARIILELFRGYLLWFILLLITMLLIARRLLTHRKEAHDQ